MLLHRWVSEFVTQYWVSMYYNSWNIRKATSHCFLDCSWDHGTIIKAKWQLSSECPSSYSTLKTSIASRILTTTGGCASSISVILKARSFHGSSVRPPVIKLITLDFKRLPLNKPDSLVLFPAYLLYSIQIPGSHAPDTGSEDSAHNQ
jgi:hypothetical protein